MTYTYLGKPVELNEHGNNAAIKVHILDWDSMNAIGFHWDDIFQRWFFWKSVYKNDITFNMTIKNEDDWRIDILDEDFLQPYDYQAMYESGVHIPVIMSVMKNVDEIMCALKQKGIISGWEVGDYI